jgi:hypothetical protein
MQFKRNPVDGMNLAVFGVKPRPQIFYFQYGRFLVQSPTTSTTSLPISKKAANAPKPAYSLSEMGWIFAMGTFAPPNTPLNTHPCSTL